MFERKSIIYEYDGTFDGFLCCVFASYKRRELPSDIQPCDVQQPSLGPVLHVQTEAGKAERVKRAVPEKISPGAYRLIQHVFLTRLKQKETYMLQFLILGFSSGKKILSDLTHPVVSVLYKAEKHLRNESHRYKQFIRFSQSNQVLVSVIKPKNQVLPLLAPHFAGRFPEEAFLIYDAVHGMALVHRPGHTAVVPADDFVMDSPDEEEQAYRKLWRAYYDTAANEDRYNPKCRMAHMPKRYWGEMTEFCREDTPDAKRLKG